MLELVKKAFGLLIVLSVFVPASFAAESTDCESSDCKGITCPLSFKTIHDYVKKCGITTIDDFLPHLPEEFRSRYVLVHDSQSIQDATPRHPRVIMFGLDAKLILAFAGEQSFKGYKRLEIIQFNDSEKKFSMHELTFDPDAAIRMRSKKSNRSAVRVTTKAKPKRCENCHGDPPRPIWDNYAGWPGVYGSVDDYSIFHWTDPAVELFNLKAFQNDIFMKYGRYRFFTEHTKFPDDKSTFKDHFKADPPYPSRPNLQFGALISRLNAQAIAREIKNDARFQPFRYALLGSLTCAPDFRDDGVLAQWLPKRLWPEKSFSESSQLTHMTINRSYHFRERRQCALLRKLNNPQDLDINPKTDCSFTNYESESLTGSRPGEITSRFEYVCLAAGKSSIQNWSMEFTNFREKNHIFFFGTNKKIGGLDLYLYKEILDAASDGKIINSYENAKRNPDGEFLFDSTDRKTLCDELSKRSLETLNQQR
jgi:hypothetical protein